MSFGVLSYRRKRMERMHDPSMTCNLDLFSKLCNCIAWSLGICMDTRLGTENRRLDFRILYRYPKMGSIARLGNVRYVS